MGHGEQPDMGMDTAAPCLIIAAANVSDKSGLGYS